MAKIERKDQTLQQQMDTIESSIAALKIDYEKYFNGVERIEPLRDREEVKRMVRDLIDKPINNATQRFRFQQLRARLQSLEMYWSRNLSMIERGVHPKMQFRADLKERERAKVLEGSAEPLVEQMPAEQEEVLRRRREQFEREERAYQLVFEKYLEARKKCGQSTDLSFDTVRTALRQQVRQIKSQYNCESVKFKIAIEDGKAKLKATPQTA